MVQFDLGMGELILGARPQAGFDEIAGNEHRPHATPTRSADVDGLEPVVRRHEPHDRPMLRMVAEGADDRWGVDVQAINRPDGSSRRAGAPSFC